jgi:DNA-directed RNA polymerase subunit N (RpoN/RPB10)
MLKSGPNPSEFFDDLEYANRRLGQVNKGKYKQDEETLKVNIMARLPNEYGNIQTKYRGNLLQKTKLEDLKADIQGEYAELVMTGVYKTETVMNVREGSQERGQGGAAFKVTCFNCGKKGHKSVDCWSKKGKSQNSDQRSVSSGSSKSKGKNKASIKCFACGKLGHYANKCPEKGQEREAMGAVFVGTVEVFECLQLKKCVTIQQEEQQCSGYRTHT